MRAHKLFLGMYVTEQNLLWQRRILKTMKFSARAILQNVSVRTDKESVDCMDGFLDQMKRGSK